MYEVAIVFNDGSKVEFHATEFDIDLTPGRLPGSPQYVYHQIQKFTYKDVDGHEAPLYLKPNQVAGIVVARTTESSKNYGLSTR
jgi:hypothetical protein